MLITSGKCVHSFCFCLSDVGRYRYGPSQLFNCHYDDSVTDPSTGFKSEWTLLIYLTGIEDGIQDGETVFYLDHNKKKPVVAPLERGTALLHRHGRVGDSTARGVEMMNGWPN